MKLPARLLLTVSEASGREIEDCFLETTEHGRLYSAIVRAISAEAGELGARFRIVILPGRDDLEKFAAQGHGYWSGWAERGRAAGLSIVDCSSALLDSGVPLADLFAPHGHYNAAASRIVARALVEHLAP